MSGYVVSGYEPASLFRYFEEISAIPRGSFNEEKIADYLCNFAKKHELSFYRDEWQNVLITRPATAGYEDRAPVLLQGHTDMVCETDRDSDHDFSREGLKLYVKDGYLRARGTTLGADNGVAVAAMLAVLDGTAPAHAPLECLFTSKEEVGLLGATAFDYSKIKARQMINLDTGEEGVAIVSCSGGIRGIITAELPRVFADGEGLMLRIGGLSGGHSGMDIHRRRANANKLMASLIDKASQKTGICLVSVDGGNKDNAIPRECIAKIKAADRKVAMAVLRSAAEELKDKLQSSDPGFYFSCEEREAEGDAFTADDTKRVIRLLNQLPDGVIEMSADFKNLVETSSNIAVFKSGKNCVSIHCSCRSSIEEKLDKIISTISGMVLVEGFTVRWDGRYPGWAYDRNSLIREVYKLHYRRLFGREPVFSAIHAGLECGLVKNAIPDMDILSIGPAVYHVHTPRESLDLASFERFWKLLCAMLS
ncbi:MAG: aminoacyl-histidine dipeptidase [Clostridiales bacterium]|nr:aminoacyl-histidine dipeptidase [Clostridiales bacterium]